MAEMIPPDQGRIVLITTTSAGGGFEISTNQPARVRWRFINFNVEFTADATGANREMYLRFLVGGVEVARFGARNIVTVNQNRIMNYSNSGGDVISTSGTLNPGFVPGDFLLNNETVIETITQNMQVGDLFGDSKLLVEEWIEPLV